MKAQNSKFIALAPLGERGDRKAVGEGVFTLDDSSQPLALRT